MDLSLYPFRMLRHSIVPLLIAAIPLVFLLTALTAGTGRPSFEQVKSEIDYNFGSNATFAASDLTKYNQIGANALIPIMRLGGISKAVHSESLFKAFADISALHVSPELVSLIIVLITLSLGYLAYAMVSNIVFNLKNGKPAGIGIGGINHRTVFIAVLAALVVMFISAFSLEGFELVFLLNFGVFFVIAIPAAAAGSTVGESFYQAIQFFRFNLPGFVTLFLLSFGVAIAAQIGLLIVFMFPLSIVDVRIVPIMKVVLTLFGIAFALYYQFVICARATYDFSVKPAPKLQAFSPQRLAKKLKKGTDVRKP